MKSNELEKRFLELLRKPVKTEMEIFEKERLRTALEESLRIEQQTLIEELNSVGITITSVWDLVNTNKSYKKAIPILIRHLERTYNTRIKEGIVRALAVKEARGIACRAVIDEYQRTSIEDDHYRWVFGNTMVIIITEEYLDDVIKVVLNEDNGDSRQNFIKALSKFRVSKVMEALAILTNSKSQIISKEASNSLRRIG